MKILELDVLKKEFYYCYCERLSPVYLHGRVDTQVYKADN